MKDLSLFVKINTYGVIFTIVAILFIIKVGMSALLFPNNQIGGIDPDLIPEIKMYDFENFPGLMGILSGGYYLHNISLPIVRNSQHPENNLRDLFLGFFMVFLSYCICGMLGYIGFQNLDYTVNQNCLNMLPSTSLLAVFVRFCVFL